MCPTKINLLSRMIQRRQESDDSEESTESDDSEESTESDSEDDSTVRPVTKKRMVSNVLKYLTHNR